MKLKCINKKFLAIIVSFLSLILCITSFGGLRTKNAKAAYNPYEFNTIGMTVNQVLADTDLIDDFLMVAIEDARSRGFTAIIVDSQFCPNFIANHSIAQDYFIAALLSFFMEPSDMNSSTSIRTALANEGLHIFLYDSGNGYYFDITNWGYYTATQIQSATSIGNICVLSIWAMSGMYGDVYSMQNDTSYRNVYVYVLPIVDITLSPTGLSIFMYSDVRENMLYDLANDQWFEVIV